MNALAWVSIGINGFIVGIMALGALEGEGEAPLFLVLAMAGAVALSLLGALMASGGERKLGARLVMVGCAVFVPIGLIGVLGARKILDEIDREEFEARLEDPEPIVRSRNPLERAPSTT
ncbi:MAG: hypothetical protein IPK13_17270 [Deltaproteobacteria bacterium]|nr:hypothetical protein [Deltaproteobacteria bacterium]